MKTLFKYMLSVYVVFCIYSLAPLANAVYSDPYTFDESTGTITDCETSVSGRLEVPSEINGHVVTTIGNQAFRQCYQLTEIVLPNTITRIDGWAFAYCEGLKSVTLPSSVEYYSPSFLGCSNMMVINVSDANPYFCSVDGVLFSEDMKKLIEYPCGRGDSCQIPAGVEIIGEAAFEWRSRLRSISIPQSINTIETGAFLKCFNISDIYYQGTEDQWNEIQIADLNQWNENVTIHYNSYLNDENEDRIGHYVYSNGEFLSDFSIEFENNQRAYLMFWHNYGDSPSDEDFIFTWEADKWQYELVGNRSRKLFDVSFIPTENGMRIRVICKDGEYYSWETGQESRVWIDAEYKPAVEQDTPSFEESEGIQSHKKEYINQHIEYYNESYNADVLPMESLRDLQYVMDDIEHDLSTAIYKGLSIATATSETVENFINLSSYIEIDTENAKFSFKVPDEVITDIGHSEYEAIIYQLMASDSVYKGILETFSTEYSDSVRGFAKEIAKNVETLAKPEIQASETKMNDLQTQINAIADTMGTADASSPSFAQAVEQFEALTEEQLDVSRTKSFLNNLTGASNVGLTFVGQILDGINSIGEAYQYACWAQSYAKTSSAFKTVLSTLRDAAYARAWGASGAGPAGDEGTLIAYSDANMYMGLYQAIDSFVETMEAYQEDTHREFVRQVSDAAVGNAAKIIVDTMQDVALDKLGGAVCPQLEAINMALTSGKLLVDLFTGIDDEYKLALAVQSLNHISTLLVDISNAYGRDLVDLNKMDSYIDLSGVIAEEKPVTDSMKFDASVLFCKSIQMYKHSIMLACEYGMKYIEDKESTSESSNAITFLSKQKLVTSEIECHDSTLDQIVFNDVPKGSYYRDAIGWAVNKGIASGTSDSTFSPDATYTRAQAVTFLWRASGSPKVEDVKNSFVDVPEDSYYHDAVLWAVSEGITSGTSTNTFSPDEQCTRGQIVTMMYRDAGSPTVQAGSGNFRDVEQNAFYSPAVNWAVSENVTSGTAEDRFGPNDACTRAQILTFLYRDRY